MHDLKDLGATNVLEDREVKFALSCIHLAQQENA